MCLRIEAQAVAQQSVAEKQTQLEEALAGDISDIINVYWCHMTYICITIVPPLCLQMKIAASMLTRGFAVRARIGSPPGQDGAYPKWLLCFWKTFCWDSVWDWAGLSWIVKNYGKIMLSNRIIFFIFHLTICKFDLEICIAILRKVVKQRKEQAEVDQSGSWDSPPRNSS